MQLKIESLNERMADLKKGIHRWEDLLKKKKKEISQLISEYAKPQKEQNDAQTQTKKNGSEKNSKKKDTEK